VFDPSHVLEEEDVQIREDLTMEVPPVALEDSRVEKLGENQSVLSKSYGIRGPVTLLGSQRRIWGSHIRIYFPGKS